jgi:hypothetical protein
MLVDKLNTDTERAEVEMECVEVKAANEQTSQVSIITMKILIGEHQNQWAYFTGEQKKGSKHHSEH